MNPETTAPNTGVVVAARGSVVDMRLDGLLPTIHSLLRAGSGVHMAIEEPHREMKAAGVLPNMAMIFAQMNGPPGARFRVGHAAPTMAEYFRDDEHRDVLLLADDIFRFVQAGSEVSGLMGHMPSRLGYQPTMGTEPSKLS